MFLLIYFILGLLFMIFVLFCENTKLRRENEVLLKKSVNEFNERQNTKMLK